MILFIVKLLSIHATNPLIIIIVMFIHLFTWSLNFDQYCYFFCWTELIFCIFNVLRDWSCYEMLAAQRQPINHNLHKNALFLWFSSINSLYFSLLSFCTFLLYMFDNKQQRSRISTKREWIIPMSHFTVSNICFIIHLQWRGIYCILFLLRSACMLLSNMIEKHNWNGLYNGWGLLSNNSKYSISNT